MKSQGNRHEVCSSSSRSQQLKSTASEELTKEIEEIVA
jgi:hypothetical protein